MLLLFAEDGAVGSSIDTTDESACCCVVVGSTFDASLTSVRLARGVSVLNLSTLPSTYERRRVGIVRGDSREGGVIGVVRGDTLRGGVVGVCVFVVFVV